MKGFNTGREEEDKLRPWQVFDLIGGTSTGGLIAIMLGRLRMSIEETEAAYIELSERVFRPKVHKANVAGRVKNWYEAGGTFNAEELTAGIKEVINKAGLPADALLKHTNPSCKVFVSAVQQTDAEAVALRSYDNPQMRGILMCVRYGKQLAPHRPHRLSSTPSKSAHTGNTSSTEVSSTTIQCV
ncbi:hypothetical protein LTR27_008703 [Elasticomyces elasticus]|nr:hypothetical protein LTR27_008703 [Elasticomyces elasticus]